MPTKTKNVDWTRAARWNSDTSVGRVATLTVYDERDQMIYDGRLKDAPPELLKFCNINLSPKPKLPWIAMADRHPPDDAPYLIFAPSADPEKPLLQVCWWNKSAERWDGLVPQWAKAITHWMPLPEGPQ